MNREGAFAALARRFGEQFATSAAVRGHHAKDISHHPAVMPDGVLYPRATADVVDLMHIARDHRLPVIPFGAGTSCEGHIHALRGGVICDMSQMNTVVAVRPDDLDCTVEAGVTRLQLNRELRGHGLHFPIDPGADATIGGMVATGASGTNAVRYRTMKENVLALTVVLSDGTVVRTGTRARKSCAGYNLTDLFVGSEGTLGLVTEVSLRVHGLAEAVSVSLLAFADVRSAVDAAVEAIRYGLGLARVELMDAAAIAACVRHAGLDLEPRPTLIVELAGSPAQIDEQRRILAEIAASHGGAERGWARETEARNRLWQARHDVYFALTALRPGGQGWPTDICVPLSVLAEHVALAQADIVASGLPGAVLGHVGDGNFHCLYIIDPDDPDELKAAKAMNELLIDRAIAAGGSCTGEHGIGHGKIGALARQHGDAIPLMRAIKRAIDPLNLMNPGKIFVD